MKALWVALLALGCSQPMPLPDVPEVDARLPMPTALQFGVTAAHWRIDTRSILPEVGTQQDFAPQPLEPAVIVRSPAFARLTETMQALKDRVGDGMLRAPAVLVVAPEIPLGAVYPAMFALGQAWFGPFSAAVRTPAGLGSLPFEPGTAFAACAHEKPNVGEAGIHPDERGMPDWNSPLEGLMHGQPRRCQTVVAWQSPQGVWGQWWSRWKRDVCTAPPQRPAAAPWTTFAVALADAPVGERCQSALLWVEDDLTWGALIEGVAALRREGFRTVKLALR